MVSWHSGDDFISDFPNGSVVIRKQQRFRLHPLGRIILFLAAYESHLAAHVFLKQLRWIEEVVFVVLFDNSKLGRLGERTEMNGLRIDRSRNIFELQREVPGRKRYLPHIPHQRHV